MAIRRNPSKPVAKPVAKPTAKPTAKPAAVKEATPENSIDDYVCGICRELLCKPYSLSCGHNFCYACLKVKSCPMCRQEFKPNELKINHVLDRILEKVFPKQYQEQKIIHDKFDRIVKKTKEYLASEHYQLLVDMLSNYIDKVVLTSVYKIKRELNKKLKRDYSYNEILYVLSGFGSKIVLLGPYVWNRYAKPNQVTQTLTIDEITIIGYASLISNGFEYRDKLFEFLKPKDNFYKYQKVDLYKVHTSDTLILKIGEEKLDMPLPPKPEPKKKSKKKEEEPEEDNEDEDPETVTAPDVSSESSDSSDSSDDESDDTLGW